MRKIFSDEYRWATSHENPHWRLVRRVTLAVTLGRDCLLPWLRANDCDHLHYQGLGRELPWFDVVPLNRRTHKAVTWLRARGFKPAVNLVLRVAYGAWFVAWLLPAITAMTFLFRLAHHAR